MKPSEKKNGKDKSNPNGSGAVQNSEDAIHGADAPEPEPEPSAASSSSSTTSGSMAPTEANPEPQRDDPPYPGVDRRSPVLVDEPHRWHDPQSMIDEIEQHVKLSHGAESDKALLREIVAFIKSSLTIDTDHDGSDR